MSIATLTQPDDDSETQNEDEANPQRPLLKISDLSKTAEGKTSANSEEKSLAKSSVIKKSIHPSVCSIGSGDHHSQSVCRMCVNLTTSSSQKAKRRRCIQLDDGAYIACRYCRRKFRFTEDLARHISSYHRSVSSGEWKINEIHSLCFQSCSLLARAYAHNSA